MKILYDHQIFTSQSFGGISKSFCELIGNLPIGTDWQIGVKQSNNHHLLNSGLDLKIQKPRLAFEQIGTYIPGHHKKGVYNLVNRLFPFIPTLENVNKSESIRLINSHQFDIFHPTYYDCYFMSLLNKEKLVITIHDMMPEIYGIDKNTARQKLIQAQRADAIIAVSEKTKEDVVRIMNISPDKIHVIYHGGPISPRCDSARIIAEPYYLFVGKRDGYKNFSRTLIDISEVVKHTSNFKLICVGPSFNQNEKDLIESLRLNNNVCNCRATDEELANLYTYAEAFIFPSLYEGFGMPILEAFAYNCPIILNETSCFPEIAQNAAIYFRSDGVRSNLAKVILEFEEMSNQEKKFLIDRGQERLSHFGWKDSAQQLNALYASLL